MNTRNLVGVGLVAALVAGIWLGNVFRGPGLGGGGGGSGSGLLPAPASPTTAPATTSPPESTPGPEAIADDREGAVRIRIDGREYAVGSIQDGGWSYSPATLSDVVARVTAAPGDSRGVRAVVQRLVTAKASAEVELQEALRGAGISDEAVDWGENRP